MRRESDISIICEKDIYGHGSANRKFFINDDLIFNIKIKNDGEVAFNSVRVEDLLPKGMKYISDNMHGEISDWSILWRDVGPLEPNEMQMIKLKVIIDGTVKDDLINEVHVKGTSHEGEIVKCSCILELSHGTESEKDLKYDSRELILPAV